MYLEESVGEVTTGKPTLEVATPPRISKTLVPALVCAVISVVLMRAGFLTFFFLVPLGVCAVVFGPAAAWLGALVAALGNGLWSAGVSHAGLDTLFFAVLILGFTWVMAGNPPKPAIPPKLALPPKLVLAPARTLFRFIAASVTGALVFLAVIFSLGSDESFSTLFRSQIEAMSSSYIAAAADAAQRAYLEQTLTTDRIIDFFSMIMLRGGALVSALFLLFLNRQAAFLLARLFRQQKHSDLIGFHAPRKAVWVLALCFPAIALCWTISLEMIEIAAWNVLIMCAVMFFAQGGGIVLFNLARQPIPMAARLLGIVVFICVLFSPGINVLALLVLIMLGIAENWFSLRVEKPAAPGV